TDHRSQPSTSIASPTVTETPLSSEDPPEPIPPVDPSQSASVEPSFAGNPFAWSNAFYAYPGAVEVCFGHMDHGSGRDFTNVYGTSDPVSKVLAFYDERYPKTRSGNG